MHDADGIGQCQADVVVVLDCAILTSLSVIVMDRTSFLRMSGDSATALHDEFLQAVKKGSVRYVSFS